MKNLTMQANEAIGRQYDRTHGEKTNDAVHGSVRTFTSFVRETFGLEKIENLKPGHIAAYVGARLTAGIGPEQLTKDLTAIRLIANGIGKANICPRTNVELGVVRQDRYDPKDANHGKLFEIRESLVDRAERSGNPSDKALIAAFDARTEFGLRANESFRTHVVEKDGKLTMEVHGAKGGLVREIPAQTERQQQVAQQYRDTSKEIGNVKGALIPPDKSAKQMYTHQKNTIEKLGGTKENRANMHIQRHSYAQERVSKGASRADVAKELGHGREEVVAHYVR
jgi:site-specific recombinase XerD